MTTLHFKSTAETRAWAKSVAQELVRPCVVLLAGELGAGKTQLVRWLLEELGVAQSASPTFAIHQRYQSSTGAVDHVDLYRLKSDADLESSGFWDLLSDSAGLVFVEWADRLPVTVWPQNFKRVFISLRKDPGSDEARQIEFEIKLQPY